MFINCLDISNISYLRLLFNLILSGESDDKPLFFKLKCLSFNFLIEITPDLIILNYDSDFQSVITHPI